MFFSIVWCNSLFLVISRRYCTIIVLFNDPIFYSFTLFFSAIGLCWLNFYKNFEFIDDLLGNRFYKFYEELKCWRVFHWLWWIPLHTDMNSIELAFRWFWKQSSSSIIVLLKKFSTLYTFSRMKLHRFRKENYMKRSRRFPGFVVEI